MIRALTFLAVLLAAFWAKGQGWPLWPVYLGLAFLILFASLILERGKEAKVAILIGSGILAMCVPLYGGWSQSWFSMFAGAVWLGLLWPVSYLNVWAGRFLWFMPIGYLWLALFPGDGPWTLIEVCGVVALLCAGGPLDEVIARFGRGLLSLRGIASRRGEAGGHSHSRD